MKRVSDLLSTLVDRKQIRGQVEAAQMVLAANDWLEEMMPPTYRDDVCAMSVQNGMLIVACTSSASAQFVMDRAEQGINYVCQKLPRSSVTHLHTRLVSEIQSHEF